MNPSTDDIIRAVDSVPAEVVFVLPNNKNIIMAAEQAVHLSEEKKLVVVPTKTIPQGISAMLAVDLDAEQDTELCDCDDRGRVPCSQRSGDVRGARQRVRRQKDQAGRVSFAQRGQAVRQRPRDERAEKARARDGFDDSAFATVIFRRRRDGGAGRRGRKPASQGKQGHGDLGHQRRSAGVLLYPVRRVKNTRFRALTDGRRVGIIQIEGHRCAVGLLQLNYLDTNRLGTSRAVSTLFMTRM